MSSRPSTWSSTVLSTLAGSPTKPSSTSLLIRGSLLAITILPSLPQRPIARPPSALINPTICLLIEPASTISTISMVARSVVRRPSADAHGTDPGRREENQVARKVPRDPAVAHGMAAIFDDDDRIVVAQHMRQGL